MCDSPAVGVDLVEVDRITRARVRWPRFLERVFTSDEIATCAPSIDAEDRFAARFAAKEAAFKALGTGWPDIRYHDVEITLADHGAPRLEFHGAAAERVGDRHAAVSLTHSAGLAIAHVMLTGGTR